LVLLGFDDAFVSEPCVSGEFGDHLLRGCLEEVEARLGARLGERLQFRGRPTKGASP
jgi:hypothetical protein